MRLSIIFSLIATLLVSALTLASDTPDPSAVAIHPGSISADDLAELLGAYVWKFDVSLPKDARQVNVSLQNAGKGQAPTQFGASATFAASPDSPQKILVAIIPINGTIDEAAQVRVTLLAFGNVCSSTVDNPLKSMGIDKPQTPETVGHGVFNLMGGYSGYTVSSPLANADVVISLKIETK
jgi:hypothetical protein